MKLAVDIGNEFNSPFSTGKTIGDLVSMGIGIAFVVAGIVLLVSFIIAGIGLISGAGESNPEKMEKGKQALTSTVIGFVVVFTAYWIVKLIEQIIPGLTLLK
ncbi:MAG: hypothetical protein AAB683_00215 [Patescibacteria group bacterium]